MRILGIDPGLRRTGFGVIQVTGSRLQYVTSGTIVVPADQPLSLRLKVILDHVREVVHASKPTVSVLEKVFVNANPTTTLLLGQARGAAMCALADCGLEVHEYTALQIKKAVVGNGHAAKEQIQHMVQHLLNLDGVPSADSADALASAICHAHTSPLARRIKDSGKLAPNNEQRLRAGRIIR
ncbi:MAG TPA: crossover junction endodeoxyribonuclease RuvC [Burkholderiaceae bacterium]|nr:crossover junction endodeoxyribonuclease RuvC [Burkholderiaceae bacterium]